MSKISNKKFIEMLDQNKISEMAKILNCSKSSINRKIKKLKNKGLISKSKTCIRGSKLHSLIGERFGKLIVIGIAERRKTGYLLECLCDCGNKTNAYKSALTCGNKKTCASKECPFHRQDYSNNGNKNVNFKGLEGIHGSKWSGMRACAKRRNLSFEITIEETWELYEQQNKKCALSGLPIEFGSTYKKGNTASLDRIDSSKGYCKENIQWVHKDINLMKMDLSLNRFLELCKLVSNLNPPV